MSLNFRFAVISDPHIALPQTIPDRRDRFHLVEVSVPALEVVLEHLEQLELDFLLLPGDLTHHGEPENHRWLAERLAHLPYPAYVVPGNHDIPEQQSSDRAVGVADFPGYYRKFGYDNPEQLYYTCEVLPGVRLIGLNSNAFDPQGKQIGMGRLDQAQLTWLQETLAAVRAELVLVMVHHNVVEHLPGQARNALGRRYMLENASELLRLLQAAGVQLVFTGHLHVQDIAQRKGVYDITTGSLVSYPHPYRVLSFHQNDQGKRWLKIESDRVTAVPGWSNLQDTSREWMGDRSLPFMLQLLTQPPLNLPLAEAEALVPHLRYFWADIAKGDAIFNFPHFPIEARRYLENFGAVNSTGDQTSIDNRTTLIL